MSNRTTNKVTIWGVEARMQADWNDAASGITYNGQATGFQVADFKHRRPETMRALLKQSAAEGAGCSIDKLGKETLAEIDDAVRVMT